MNIFKRFFKLRKNTKCKHNIGFNKYKKYVACNKYHTLVNKNKCNNKCSYFITGNSEVNWTKYI